MKKDEVEFGRGMPGVRAKKLKGLMVRSINGYMAALKSYRAATDAGDHGACSVHRQDDGKYCCMFMVRHFTQEQQVFSSQRQVVAWLKEWHPKCRQWPNAA
jgi:hypothetical protein